jgi:hypothetical protein
MKKEYQEAERDQTSNVQEEEGDAGRRSSNATELEDGHFDCIVADVRQGDAAGHSARRDRLVPP